MKTPHRGENKKAEKPALNPRLEITFLLHTVYTSPYLVKH